MSDAAKPLSRASKLGNESKTSGPKVAPTRRHQLGYPGRKSARAWNVTAKDAALRGGLNLTLPTTTTPPPADLVVEILLA